MITNCPHCGQKTRVKAEGKYRCPSCREIFQYELGEEETPSAESVVNETEMGTDFYVDVPSFEVRNPHHHDDAQSTQEDADLYIDSEEDQTACETCGRPGSPTICHSCGAFVCNECAVTDDDDHGFCPKCAADLINAATGEKKSPGAPQGFLDEFMIRVKQVLLTPRIFFSKPATGEPFFHPYLFALICYSVGGIFTVAYNIVFQRTLIDAMDAMNVGLFSSLNMESLMSNPGEMFLQGALLMPLQAMMSLFFVSGIVHLFLLLFGRSKLNFAGTIRVVAFSNVTHLFQVVPLLGGLVAFVWQLWIVIIGTGRTHGISTNRAALAVMLPFGLLMALGLVLVLMVLPVVMKQLGL